MEWSTVVIVHRVDGELETERVYAQAYKGTMAINSVIRLYEEFDIVGITCLLKAEQDFPHEIY